MDRVLKEAIATVKRLEANGHDQVAAKKLEHLAKLTHRESVKDYIALNLYRITNVVIYPFALAGALHCCQVKRFLRRVGIYFIEYHYIIT